MRVRGYAPGTACLAEYVAADSSAAASFYGGLFGWAAGDAFTLDDRVVAGLRVGSPGQPAAWLTYFATDDLEASAGLARDAGGLVLMPPTDIGDRGRAALVRDPSGAVFGLWRRGRIGGAELIDQPNTTCWTELLCRDEGTAVSFYGKLFGWSDRVGGLPTGMAYTEWTSGSRVVGGMLTMDERFPESVPSHWRTTFEVSDCAAAEARATELGGQVVVSSMGVGVGTYAQIIDPLGGSFGVFEAIPELRQGW